MIGRYLEKTADQLEKVTKYGIILIATSILPNPQPAITILVILSSFILASQNFEDAKNIQTNKLFKYSYNTYNLCQENQRLVKVKELTK